MTTTPASGRPVRVGVAGAGGFASSVMAPVLHRSEGVVLHAAAARSVARAEALAPVAAAYATYDELLADPDVEVVYVCLSNDLHRPVAEAALAAGKHVLCEKPLGLSLAEVESMQAVAEAHDRLLVEAFWYRWHPRQAALEALTRSGGLGPVRLVDAGFCFEDVEGRLAGNFRLERARGGGAAYDVGCYAASFAVAVLGDQAPVSAAVVAADTVDGVDLRTDALLRFGAGAGAGAGAAARAVGGFTGPDRRWGVVEGTSARVTLGEPSFSHDPEPDGTTWLLERLAPDGTVTGREQRRFPPADPRRAMVEAFAAVVRGDADRVDVLPVTDAHSRAVARATDLTLAALP